MFSFDPRLPQLSPQESEDYVPVEFWRRFQQRFYILWRELSDYITQFTVQAVGSSTDNQIVRFDGTTGRKVQGSDVYVTDDGRLYGTALHNNAGAVTGTANQYVASGTYTPTLTIVTNGSASTISQAQWMRVGNVVTVSGYGTFDPTTAAFSNFGLSLPIASNFTGVSNLQGAGTAFNTSDSAKRAPMAVYADTTNDRAFLNFVAETADNHEFSFVFTYVVL